MKKTLKLKMGTPRDFEFEPKAHWDLVEELKWLTLNVLLKYLVLVSYT